MRLLLLTHKRKKQERKIVRLQNKTNSQLYELLEGNNDRDVNKISGPHRISSKQEKKIYDEIGYNSNDNNTDEIHHLIEENEQIVIDGDGQQEPMAIEINPHKHVISNSKKSVKDSLTNGGIA